MAFILGIYDELIEAIHAIDMRLIKNLLSLRWKEALATFPWQFLLALGLGIVSAVLSLSNGLHWALETHPSLVWAFFFGLILASIFVVRKRVRHWSFVNIAAAGLAAVLAYLLVGLSPEETPHTPLLLFLSGAIAICAMILPGVSGAFLLVLLGQYRYILGVIVRVDILTIALVGMGAVVGLVSFVRLLRWLLRTNHDLTVAILTGFMLGSLRKVWPWKNMHEVAGIPVEEVNFIPTSLTTEVGLALGLILAGVAAVMTLERLAHRQAQP